MAYEFRCDAQCGAKFTHPEGDDCQSVRGHCEHLIGAGWRPVWLKVYHQSSEFHLFSRGGWLCPECGKPHAARYGPLIEGESP
jgi:hypothetical protein